MTALTIHGRTPASAWLLSPLLVALTTGGLLLVQLQMSRATGQEVRPYGIGYLVPLVFITALGGLRVGALTLALSLLSAMLVLMPPRSTLQVADPRNWTELAFILLTGGIALASVEAWRRTDALRLQAQQARLETERALAALRASEEQYRLITEAVPTLAWSNRPDGSQAFFNRRWREYAGSEQTAEAWTDTVEWLRAVHPDDRPRLMETRTRGAETGSPYESEIRLRRADGVYRWHLARVVPAKDERGAITSWFGAALDITDRREAEEEIRRLNENLERRVAERTSQLREANEELEAFSYTVSHDLRAPLRAMQGFAQALEEDFGEPLPPEGREYVRRIAAAGDRMGHLIQDLLDYSRLSRAELSLRAVSLQAALDDALGQLAAELEDRGARVEVAAVLPRVQAHPPTLVQVFANLLSNAVKFVEAGVTPRVRVWAERVGAPADGRVRVWVEDNGLGIAPEYQDRVFRVFERLHGVDRFPGTGIGLAIVRKGAERMGGGPESGRSRAAAVGSGLNCRRPGRRPHLRLRRRRLTATPSDTILLVEDDPNDVLLIRRAFRKAGLTQNIHVLDNGEDVVVYLDGQGEYADRARYPLPRLVLLDLKLPRRSGLEVLQWLRERPEGRPAPVVILTSSRETADIGRAYELGASSYLVKPVTFDALQEMMSAVGAYWLTWNQPHWT